MNQNNDNNNILPLMVRVLIFDQVELLDMAGPFEVFFVTCLNQKEKREVTKSLLSPFKVILIAEKLGQTSTIGDLHLSPDVSLRHISKTISLSYQVAGEHIEK